MSRSRQFVYQAAREAQPLLAVREAVLGLRRALAARVPELDTLARGAMISMDEEYAPDEAPIWPSSRLALIPPVSGGSGGTDSGNETCDD